MHTLPYTSSLFEIDMLSWLTCIITKALKLKVGKLDALYSLGFRSSIKQNPQNSFVFLLCLIFKFRIFIWQEKTILQMSGTNFL